MLTSHQTFNGTQSPEAKSVILLVKNASNFTRIDHYQWLLKRLFQPLNLENDNSIQVLHVSNTPLASLIQSQNERKASKIYTPQSLPVLETDKSYKLMPHSRIITFNTKYRFVFLLDTTSSLTTIDCSSTKEDIVMSEVMQTTCRCLEGLVQPFIIQDLDNDIALQFEPEISITIIAECSNFASNANLIPKLAEFPTMRVLLQGVVVNRNNVSDIINNLSSEFARFQDEVAEFRQNLRRTKFSSTYIMEVMHESETSTSYLDKIWRLGLSGSNLAYSLNAGLFAINLLPNEGFPALIVITDGVVNSNLAQMSHDDDIIQQLCKEGIRCNIIQIGPREEYSFGLIPDNEILRFVAMATSGIFLYSTDCPDVHDVKSSKVSLSHNFYHKKLLMIEAYFSRKRSPSRQIFDDNYNFPWDPKSQPPAVEVMPTRYREYSLSIDVMQLIFARMRNGFIIESIVPVTGRNVNETERVHITMTRFWQPNVTIQYKIKALWMGEVYGFSRLKSPRIEINVVADTLFAIYLINFQRAQQNNDPSHPLFLKCIRLHKFMTMIYETDELLKKHIFHKINKESNKLPLHHRIAIGNGIPPPRLGMLKQLWDSFEQNPMRRNTNIWYDEAKFDIIISRESSSTITSVNKLLDDQQNKNAFSTLKERLRTTWSSSTFSDKVYVKTFHPIEGDKIPPISFCELRINKESENLVTGDLKFFNVEAVRRQQVLENLINLVNGLNSCDLNGPLFYICSRPLSSFLIRDSETANEITPDNHHVTGQSFIVKSYLRHWRWTWMSDIEHYAFLMDYRNIPIRDLAFQRLCQSRLDEGCLLISDIGNKKVFYQELELKGNSDISSPVNQNRIYGVQHHIYMDYSGEIITELWMEPSQQPLLRDLYESVANKISAIDRQILSQLVTFDQIYYIAKTRVTHRRNSYGLTLPKPSRLPSLFNLPILLRSSGLIIANYNIPSFKSLSKANLQSVKSSMSGETSSYEDPRSLESSPYIRKGSISNRNLLYMEATQQKKLSLSLPKNPTIEITYIIDRASIASLSPLDRDFALLHLFVEKTLTNYADGEVDTNNIDSKDSILKEITSGLSKTDIFQETSTTITYIKNLRESRCFIKIVDFSSFLLIIIPSFRVVLDIMKQNRGFQVDNKSCFMNIIIFLCKRPQIRSDSINKSLDFSRDPLSFETISLSHKAVTPAKNSLEPRLLSGSFSENFSKSDPLNQATQSTLNITKLYSHGFVKSVYASVLQKHKVTKTDFLKAIDTCMETSVDIDITGYVNVHVKASREGPDSDDVNDVYQKFVAVLGHYFEPANFVEDEDELQNIYYYRPNFKKPNSLSIDNENVADIVGSFLDVFNYAENPLFLRLECTFKKPASTRVLEDIDYAHRDYRPEESSFVKFPVSSLPTSYSCTVGGKFYDFSPESIGTKTSPVESSDGTTATLHLICLTLPKVDNEIAETALGFVDLRTDNNGISVFENTKENMDSLTTDKQEALAETRNRIDWLLREEIMHGLLKSQPVEKLVLSYIQAQLKHKNPFVDFPTTFDVMLSFVDDEKGQERFLKEFSKTNMSPYSLNQVEDCFYISEDEEKSEPIIVNSSSEFDPDRTSENSSVNNIQKDAYNGDHPDEDNDFCQGLGISIYHPEEKDTKLDQDQNVKSVKKYVVHKQLFWLLLIPQETRIQMYFYSKAVSAIERANIIKHVRKCIVQISEKVNRLVLLDELYHSRSCSNFLVPSDGSPDSEGEFSSDLVDVLSMAPNDRNVTVSKKFRPGEFECPLVYEQSFPLHWRLRPNQALNGIASSTTLNAFEVSNRKNMYVIRSGDCIVYLKISEIEASPTYIVDENFDDASQFANLESQSNIHAIDESRKSPPKNEGSPRKSNAQARVTDSRELVVKVFGLETPGKEITEKLMESLEKRLISNITLNVMFTFLARNLKVNPTRADVDFILPILKTPHRLSLKGPEVTNAIKRHYNSNYGTTEFPEPTPESGRKTHDIQLHEFVFFYNNNQPRAQHSFEASVGQGIAGLCFTLLNRQGQPVFELSVPDTVDSDDIDLNKILECISNDEALIVSDSNKSSNNNILDAPYMLLIELWSHCPLNYNILLNRITKSFQQSLCDYFIEVSITKGLGRVSVENNIVQVAKNLDQGDHCINEHVEPHVQHNFVEPVLELLNKASDLENPALNALRTRLDMPSWMMDNFLNEVHDLLVEVHEIFTPIILRTIPTKLTPKYDIYRPKHSISTMDESISVPHQYLLIAGLKEMNAKYDAHKPDNRRSSVYGSDVLHSRRSSTENGSNEKTVVQSRKSSWMPLAVQKRHLIEDIMMHTILSDHANRNTSDLFRSCFLVMSINGFDLTIYTYNWDKQYAEQVFTAMKRISDWHNKRIELLNNIFHQKMGLFYHTNNIFKTQPQTPLPIHSNPNTPRLTMSGTNRSNVTTPNDQSTTTDLIHVYSLISERFPQRQNFDIRPEESKKISDARHEVGNLYSTGLEANRFILTSSDLNDVLKDSCVEKVAACDISSVSRDALMRHGPPFIESCIRQAKMIQAHDNAEKVYKKWEKRYQGHKEENPDTNEVIAKSDLAIIFRTARLLHFCRTPLLFGGKVESIRSSDIHTLIAPDRKDKTIISQWYKDMVETFLQEYSSNLEKLGMQVVMGGKSGLMLVDDGDKVFYTSRFSAPDSPAVFLLKELKGGSIMCEIRIQEIFVCVTLYTLNHGRRLMKAPGIAEIDRYNLRVFTEECGRFKKMIHVNSFVYDFHLKYIKHVLESLGNSPSFNVLEVLRAFIRRHSQPAYFAAHRIYHDTFNKESPTIPNDLFEYIIKNPLRYGFRSTCYDGKPISCFATLSETKKTFASIESDIDQQNQTVYDSETTHCTLIFTEGNQLDKSVSGKISLEYFVIVLHNDTDTSIEAETTVSSSEYIHSRQPTTDLSYLDLLEIKNCSENKLDSIISQATQFYRRDSLWRVLCNAKPNSNNNAINVQDFLELKNQWHSRELITIYPDFKEFLDMNLNWTELLNFLARYHSEFSRELYDEENNIRHLVILNSHTYDLLLHFILSFPRTEICNNNNNGDNGKLIVNIVCREALDFKEFELQFAADLARTIGYWLWDKLT
ncbi:KICSTOR complex protein SZT2-like isoform X1 [Rhizophagus clarus]|uniref:KICSTOR complex protein SZT2-like isoform X1 n=1 Tax=Rhizophagus clarus TaxID=94130 RepID=A0A8H3LQ39_9GLOM|nr:KICSTOR complex protein SZT2-like isoform X1 [Rhizophagus clarus]